MISPRPYRAADINSLSELRTGNRLIGVRMMREMVRASEPSDMLEQARSALRELMDETTAHARNDHGPLEPREKAAEFILAVRSQGHQDQSLSDIVNRVGEATARTRHRSRRVLDFLATWLFIAGEQFIDGLTNARARIDLEVAHAEVWCTVRSGILEWLEAGRERQREGRRFRLAELYLARFRLVRARNDERSRSGLDTHQPLEVPLNGTRREDPDYVSSMVVDIFALSISDIQQRLILSRIPRASRTGKLPGMGSPEHERLWMRLRATRTDQGYARWSRICRELGLDSRAAAREFTNGMLDHLKLTWEWLFPDQAPFGPLRSTLRDLQAARLSGESGDLEQDVQRLFSDYCEALCFVADLATQDCRTRVLDLGDDGTAQGVY